MTSVEIFFLSLVLSFFVVVAVPLLIMLFRNNPDDHDEHL